MDPWFLTFCLMPPYSKPELDARTPSIRGRCWKLLLEVHHVSAQEYVSLVKRGKPEEYAKIRNDTFRTLATDQKYLDAVKEDSLIRVLCAFAWSNQGKHYYFPHNHAFARLLNLDEGHL